MIRDQWDASRFDRTASGGPAGDGSDAECVGQEREPESKLERTLMHRFPPSEVGARARSERRRGLNLRSSPES